MIASAIGVLFDGFAYGMLLFLLSVGLSVTLGMMNFVNLAHCSFAMLGGFVTVTLTNELGWPFLASLPLAFVSAALVSVAFERVLYRRLYRASDLDQCLLTIGSIGGSFVAASLLGISDMAGKYYFPELGAFLIYFVMVALLMWRPVGLFGRR